MAFHVADSEMDAWRAHLEAADIPIESTIEWPRGGRSLYVRDPDGHTLELATPDLWSRLRPAL